MKNVVFLLAGVLLLSSCEKGGPMDTGQENLTQSLAAVQSSVTNLPDRKSTRLNSSHSGQSRMPSSA